VGSVIQSFNKDVVSAALARYSQALEHLRLPLSVQAFADGEAGARQEAQRVFAERSFGEEDEDQATGGGLWSEGLTTALAKAKTQFVELNKFSSYRTCDSCIITCSADMDALSETVLPSRAKFDATQSLCNSSFQLRCQGPSRVEFENRQATALKRDAARFFADYNARLLQSLTVSCLAIALVARFVVKSPVVELLAWGGLAFFELGPKLLSVGGGGSFYVSHNWLLITSIYEALVYNELYDLTDTRQSVPIGSAMVLSGLFYHFRQSWAVRYCCHRIGCGRMARGRQQHKAALPIYHTSTDTTKDAFA
jgi:hypothetical protein